ncbi:MAG: preprotein translocase subunit SecG [Desulfobacterales bacterium]|nr:preprotein translocase subunit SecG [Desulfobacterales bacterium]
MTLILTVIHVMVCIALILIVLFQTGKGADMGAAFGGGSSQTLFGSTGASTFLSKATTAAAVVFMVTSLWLAYNSGNRGSAPSIVTDAQAPISETAPAQPAPDAAPPASTSENAPAGETE